MSSPQVQMALILTDMKTNSRAIREKIKKRQSLLSNIPATLAGWSSVHPKAFPHLSQLPGEHSVP